MRTAPTLRRIAAAFALLGCTVAAHAQPRDPFTLTEVTRKIGAGGFPNTTMNPFRRTTICEIAVAYRGAPVALSAEGDRVDRFSEAWRLAGAARPAVLLASAGFHLATERDGALVLEALTDAGTDVPALQWLDAAGGEPAAEQSVTLRDHRGEPHVLAGGTLLLLDHAVVLDVRTLRIHRVRAPLFAPEANAYGVAGEPARALSPGKTAYVLAGSDESDEGRAALVVVDFGRDEARPVPYDPRALGASSVWDVTPAWIARHFLWTRDASGRERLAPR